MSLTHWDPLRDLEQFGKRLGMFLPTTTSGQESFSATSWRPSVDVSETPEAYQFVAELPGVSKDDIELTVDNGVLMLKGTRHSEHEDKSETVHRIECSYGSFMRSFQLPGNVNPEMVAAQFSDGLLTVKVAKTDLQQPPSRRVRID